MTEKEKNYYMNAAINISKKGIGHVSPNPCVGAVLVKNNSIISKGYHKKYGENHAEINAINNSQQNTKGATLFVTLEPCNHQGKTPPCTDAIIKAGIKKVYIACVDPNPKMRGKSIKILEDKGIKCYSGVMKNKAEELIKHYKKATLKKTPYICLKIAQSLDGKIALNNGISKWITNLSSRKYVHKLRTQHEAILIGVNTVIKDNSKLNIRHCKGPEPYKIVLDTNLRTPKESLILSDPKTIIVHQCNNKDKIEAFKKNKYSLLKTNNIQDLKQVLKLIHKKYHLNSILVEGGAKIFASFIKSKLVDQAFIFIAPKIIGSDGLNSISELNLQKINSSNFINIKKIARINEDICLNIDFNK